METKLHDLLNIIYEAEGLLEMAIRRADNSSAEIARLACKKCFAAADLAATLDLDNIADTPTPSAAPASSVDDAESLFIEKIAPIVSDQAEAPIETREQPAEPVPSENQIIEASNEEELAEELSAEAIKAEAENIMAHNDDYEPINSNDSDDNLEKTKAAPDKEDIKAELSSVSDPANPAIFGSEEFAAEEFMSEAADELPEEDEGDYVDDLLDEADNELEEEEAEADIAYEAPINHSANLRRPIATFFSINDKYRFRRELFANNNPEWLNALAILETFPDLEAAHDYLYNDLQWDPESPDVQAFDVILTRYYKS